MSESTQKTCSLIAAEQDQSSPGSPRLTVHTAEPEIQRVEGRAYQNPADRRPAVRGHNRHRWSGEPLCDVLGNLVYLSACAAELF
jgi:hypothetical protein